LERDKVKLREWVARKHAQGWGLDEIASHAQVPRSTCHRWITWAEEGRTLEDLSRKPKHTRKISPFVVMEIIVLRLLFWWGPDKIKAWLGRQGTVIGQRTVYRIICKWGLNRPLSRPRKRLRYIRWERENPNDLWQTDWKWVPWLGKWLIAYLDDHSRLIAGAGLFDEATAENALGVLKEAVRRYGTPRQILTDNGTQFIPSRGEESSFTKALKEMGIEHITSGIRKPTTLGKIERWFHTYEEELRRYRGLEDAVRFYNVIRIHQSLGYKTPIEVYQQSQMS
jgi:putative transposase